MYIVIGVIVSGVLMVLFFILGAMFCRHLVMEAQEQARYDAMRYESYRLAGVQKMADPRPYVPPRPRTPRARGWLPGLTQLDRMMREGKRGTILWRPEDRK